jgi:hypothetical protein
MQKSLPENATAAGSVPLHKSVGAIPSIPLGKDAVQDPRVLNGDSLRRQKNQRAAKVYAPAIAIREVRVATDDTSPPYAALYGVRFTVLADIGAH